jgi:hypothetical protein
VKVHNDHNQARPIFQNYKPPPYRGRPAAQHLEHAEVLIGILRQNESLQTDAALQWSMETMRSIALFCVAGAAAAFAVMQVSDVKMPLFQGIAGALFLIGFGLCIWRMHRSAGMCSDAVQLTQDRLRVIGKDPSITLEEIAAPLIPSEEQKSFADWTYRIGWISAAFASSGAALLIATIVYRSATQ